MPAAPPSSTWGRSTANRRMACARCGPGQDLRQPGDLEDLRHPPDGGPGHRGHDAPVTNLSPRARQPRTPGLSAGARSHPGTAGKRSRPGCWTRWPLQLLLRHSPGAPVRSGPPLVIMSRIVRFTTRRARPVGSAQIAAAYAQPARARRSPSTVGTDVGEPTDGGRLGGASAALRLSRSRRLRSRKQGQVGVNARYLVNSRDKLNVPKNELGNNVDLHATHHNDSTDHPSSRC